MTNRERAEQVINNWWAPLINNWWVPPDYLTLIETFARELDAAVAEERERLDMAVRFLKSVVSHRGHYEAHYQAIERFLAENPQGPAALHEDTDAAMETDRLEGKHG